MKYQIIYADPPWSYNDKMAGHSFSLDHEYETQSSDWIGKLPVKEITDDNAVLFMWAVSPQIPQAIDVMESWGFKYKTVAFCWVKQSKNKKILSNLGRWTMGGMEVCLLGVKGKPNRWRQDKSIKQLVFAERTRHSQKPNEVRNRIVQLLGDRKRIELFAREKTQGWDIWGNELKNDIELLEVKG